MKKTPSLRRQFRAAWRDTFLLLRDFRAPLFLFALVIIGGGLLYFDLAHRAGEPIRAPVEAVYLALTLVFLQGGGSFPQTWYLQIFYFAMPIVGISILAQGLADFGVLLFNRRARGREWEMAVASTFNNHIILVGLGHLGFRVVTQLRDLNQDVVVIEQTPREDLVDQLRLLDVPILQGDGTREALLDAAGVCHAHTLVLCTQNDNLNLHMAVKARSMNPNIRVITRIFDDDFAQALQKQFGFSALSATGMAAPVFAAAAAGMDISQPITIEGKALSLARLNIAAKSKLAALSVNQIEQKYDVSVVLVRHDSQSDMHPAGDVRLAAN
ncbi:partial Voltage-gated potassium channel Kch, partial [Anaerolineae bacterium]